MEQILLALIIGSLNNTALLYTKLILVALFVTYTIVNHNILYIDSIVRIYSLFLIAGILSSILFVIFNNIPADLADIPTYFFSTNSKFSRGISIIVNLNRQYLIEIIFSICLYYRLSEKPLNTIYSIIYYSVLLNLIALIAQILLTNKFFRLSLLFPEPSSAGYFYCFVFYILSIDYFKSNLHMKIISQGFRYLGILIFSKGQLISLFILSLLKIKLKSFMVILSVIFVIIFSYPRISNSLPNEITTTVTEAKIFSSFIVQDGISANGVASTYITRYSSIFFAIKSIVQFPFGIGFGTFDSLFSKTLNSDKLPSIALSTELSDTGLGYSYGSPRSNLLELLLSSGLIAIIIMLKIFLIFYRNRIIHKEIYNAFLLFIIASLFLELNSFFVMLTFLIVILKKQLNIEKSFSIKTK